MRIADPSSGRTWLGLAWLGWAWLLALGFDVSAIVIQLQILFVE